MTPLDFIMDNGDDYNMPVGNWQELIKKDIRIFSNDTEWEILSYYPDDGNGKMCLDIRKIKE
jgi:hypothetical protein